MGRSGAEAPIVMIEIFAIMGGTATSAFLDSNHTSKHKALVFLMLSKLVPDFSREPCRASEAEH